MTDPIGPLATVPYGPNFDPLEGLRVGLNRDQQQVDQMLDPQAFLQLLVAQLQYQDPTNPADTSEFMNQTAMLSQVQSMNAMSSAVFEMITAQQTTTATSMIGKAISYIDPSGEQAAGVVTSVSMHGGVPLLHVGDVGVPLSGVLEVAEPVDAAPSTDVIPDTEPTGDTPPADGAAGDTPGTEPPTDSSEGADASSDPTD